ncbi:MAG: hypothetical protein CVV41_12965 [Candidatus Riflebacteria bacterium HGW-Riflebacteria-1]|jgi:hypothetical protein|nr:MAG: hypothetical protein CVV41_12965 [Candidatus Riflebacteria bacterium HGW-Riflebacteria-1]
MRNSTIKVLSKLLCIVLIASFLLEAPLMAEYSAIKVNVGGQSVNVTPGQWVTVNNGPMTTHYNVRYVNGQPMALEMSQYLKLAFDGSGAAGSAAQATTAAQTSQGIAAQSADASTAVSGAKAEGSWVKNELNSYGQKVKDSFTSGKESGQNFGNKTTDAVKTGAGKVGDVVKTGGSKIGNLLKSAKDRISNLFSKKTPDVKPGSSDASQSGQASQDAAQSGQTSQEGSQASQEASQSGQSSQESAQSGQTSQEGAQASQEASQAGQSSQESGKVADADKKGFLSNLKDKTTGKFKSGYDAGKEMTGQGVQNVKDSLKSGFSPKNILMTAGITVGVDLATQILSGEKPSLRKAVKTVVSAEFAGGVVGSVTGAAAGSFFTPFLTAIPVVGGVLSALAPTFGSIVGGSVGAYLAGDLKNGRFSIKEAFKQINWVGVAGQTIGSTAGAMLGSMIFPPFGTIIGGIAGGMLGNWAANKLAGLFGKGNTSYGSIGMPVGSNPFGGAAAGAQVSGPVTIGSVAGSTGGEIPVSGAQSPEISISGEATPMGTYSSEVQLAQAKYQELYKLYNEMLTQGRQADAMKVAQEMNKAKAEYESLKANAGK